MHADRLHLARLRVDIGAGDRRARETERCLDQPFIDLPLSVNATEPILVSIEFQRLGQCHSVRGPLLHPAERKGSNTIRGQDLFDSHALHRFGIFQVRRTRSSLEQV